MRQSFTLLPSSGTDISTLRSLSSKNFLDTHLVYRISISFSLSLFLKV